MRLQSFLALAAAATLLMPLAANAETRPEDKKGAYMERCVQAATGQGLNAQAAGKHCECGADALKKNFTTKEIEDLDSEAGVDAKLKERARAVVTQACVPKN